MNSHSWNDNAYGSSDEFMTGTSQRYKRSSASLTTNQVKDEYGMRNLYQFDPLEHYYSQASQQDAIEPAMGKKHSMNLSSSQKNNYDFQRNQEDRDINVVQEKMSTTHQRDSQAIIDNRPKRKKAMKRKYQGNQEIEVEENEEQRLEREKFYKERRMRRSRFRHDKKYDFSAEEDVGGNVRTFTQMMLRHTSHSSRKPEADIEVDDQLLNSHKLIPLHSQHTSITAHPVESLIRRAETYLSAGKGDPNRNGVVDNDPMRYLKMGYSAPQGHELPFIIQASVAMVDTPKRVHVECNDAYRRAILGLEEWPQVQGNAIRLPRFKGDTVGFKLSLKGKEKYSRKSKVDFEKQNVLFGYEILPKIPSSRSSSLLVKSLSFTQMKASTVRAGIFPPEKLPRACFNPVIKRARFPSTLDTFHYFPLSSRYINEDSSRFNTAQRKSYDFILSTNPATVDFFRPTILKSSTVLDRQSDFIHYRYASQLTARLICGSAGSLSASLNYPDEVMARLLRFLNRDTGKWCRSHWIIRASQEMACNKALWIVIEPIMTHLVSRLSPKDGRRLIADLELIKGHLLTGEGLLRNPFSLSMSTCLADISLRLRRELWGYVRFAVRKLRKLLLEPDNSSTILNLSNISLENESRNSEKPCDQLTVDEFIDRFLSGNDGQVSCESKYPQINRSTPPFYISFCLFFTKKIREVNQYTEFNELFSQITHQGKIDINGVQLTMASLLTELSVRCLKLHHCSGNDYSFNLNKMAIIHQQILSYLDMTSLLLGNYCKTIRKNIISSPLAATIVLRQSYIANIGIDFTNESKRQRSSYDENVDDVYVDNVIIDSWSQMQIPKASQQGDIRQVAKNLVTLGESIKDFQLSLFSNIHLTTGIAELCTILSAEAADILSRSWAPDEIITRTPFDLVRLALTKMDSLGHIHRNDVYSMSLDGICVSDMITTFDKVADSFHRCLSFNPCDVIHLSWHLAARAGTLILASGLVLYETKKKGDPTERNGGTQIRLGHRSRHENYSYIRASTAAAFRDLLLGRPASLYSESLHHLMISSFLEWRDVVRLLSSRPNRYHDPYRDIRKLHISHILLWITSNPTKENLMRIWQLCINGEVNYDTVLSAYASMIERKPYDISAWVNFAILLGPFASRNSTNKKLVKWRGWWGEGRQWWEQFFQFDLPQHFHVNNPELFKTLSQWIIKKIKKSRQSTSVFLSLKEKTKGINIDTGTNILSDISWMIPEKATSDGIDDDDDFSEDSVDDLYPSRYDDYRDLLPKCHADVVSDEKIIRLLLSFEESSLWRLQGFCKILCAKILVCGHLFGHMHSFISVAINFLLSLCTENGGESVAIHALKCLIDHGFLIQRYITKEETLLTVGANSNFGSSFERYSFLKL